MQSISTNSPKRETPGGMQPNAGGTDRNEIGGRTLKRAGQICRREKKQRRVCEGWRRRPTTPKPLPGFILVQD